MAKSVNIEFAIMWQDEECAHVLVDAKKKVHFQHFTDNNLR